MLEKNRKTNLEFLGQKNRTLTRVGNETIMFQNTQRHLVSSPLATLTPTAQTTRGKDQEQNPAVSGVRIRDLTKRLVRLQDREMLKQERRKNGKQLHQANIEGLGSAIVESAGFFGFIIGFLIFIGNG